MTTAEHESTVLVALSGVSREFGSGENATRVLSDIHLSVDRGEFVAVVGASGAGKSTLLNILGLLDEATTGTYSLDGVRVEGLRERGRDRIRSRTIGFVFQDGHMLADESAASNVALALRVQGYSRPAVVSATMRALARVGMLGRATTAARLLSGGERQRVAIARAIASEPPLILADEPTGALDSVNSRVVIEHLRTLNSAGSTVIVITHDETVAAAADRRVEVVDGRLDDGRRAPVPADPTTSIAHPRKSGQPGVRFSVDSLRRGGARLGDAVVTAISTLAGRPGRTALLLSAFLLGTGGLVCSLGISQSAAAQVSERLTQASLDEVIVRSKSDRALAERFYSPGNEQPSEIVGRLRGVVEVGFRANVDSSRAALSKLPAPPDSSGAEASARRIIVGNGALLRLSGARVSPGSAVDLLDNQWGAPIALVGSAVAKRLGFAHSGAGSSVWVEGQRIDVAGIIQPGGRDGLLAESVVLSPHVLDRIAVTDPEFVVRTAPGFPAPVAEAIPLAIAPDDPSRIAVSTVADLRSVRLGVSQDLGSLVGAVAWSMLALACLTAATATYLSVQARRSEIALRRAVGASRFAIWRLFMVEGLLVGAAGGIAGSAVGLAAVLVACVALGWVPTLDGSFVFVGVGAGIVTGIVSAAYPALLAARARPAEAIRKG